MATTLDWVKSLRADIRGDCGKGWNLRGREVGGKMVMQIDRNDENGRSTLLTNIGWRKDNKRNILNAIVEIKDFMYHNGDSLKEAYKKFSNHIGLIPIVMISPYDTDLINEGSIERRKFIDGIISQNDKSYLRDLIDYNKIIQNRNKLLKNSSYNTKSNLEMIDVYDDKIIELSDPIHEKRISFIK